MDSKDTKTLVIAHRGASKEAPENTLPAFERAKALGADGVELDVMPCKEGSLVVTHNEILTPLTGIQGKVKDFSLSELKKMDFGSHFSLQFRGEKIPTLEEVFDLLKGTLLLNIEIKGINLRGDDRELELIRLIRKWGIQDQVLVSSFNIFSLRRMWKLAPEIRRGYLFYEKQIGLSRRGGWSFFVKPYSWNISRALVGAGTLDKIHRKGFKAWVWTVNEEAEMKRLINEGAQAIITDDPKGLKTLLS